MMEIELHPNTFRTSAILGSTLKLCLNSTCESIWLNKKEPNYFELGWKDDSDNVALNKVEKKIGEFCLREMRYSVKKK